MRVLFAAMVVSSAAVGCGSSSASSGPATGTVAPYPAPTVDSPTPAPTASLDPIDGGPSAKPVGAPPGPIDKKDPSPSSPAPMPQKSDPSPSKGSENEAPSPSQVCSHLASVLQKEFAAAGAQGAPSGTDPECVKKAEGEKQKDPKGYACDAACVVAAKDFAGIQACSGKCKS